MTTLEVPVAAGLRDYAHGTFVDDLAWWLERYCVQSVDRFAGEPLVLEPWQCEFMSEALAVTEDGLPYWQTVVLVLPRKNGKTTMLGGYALYHLLNHDGAPEVLLAASSDKQAGRLFDSVTGFIRRSPALLEDLHMREYIGEVARVDGMGKMLRMASDPSRAHGYNPSRVIIDELHAWTTPTLRRAWAAFTTGGGARADSQVFVITTEGEAHLRDESILGKMCDLNEARGVVERPHPALTVSRNHDARTLVYRYSAPTRSRDDFDAVRQANPASFVSDDYLRKQIAAPEITDAEFLQLHACVAADSEDVFIPTDAWDACAGVLDPPEGVYLGLDGSYTYDTTAVAWAWPDRDGVVNVDARVFSARREAPSHEVCPGGKIDFAAVEAFTVEKANAAAALAAAFDPNYLGRSAELIAEQTRMAVFDVQPQSAHMREAVTTLHRLVTEGKLRHNGDPVLRAHVKACVGAREEGGWRIRKRQNSKPIDAVVAMAMAVWRAARAAHPYEARGMVVL